MTYMFTSCVNLEEIDLSSFDTSKVTLIGYLFTGCTKLKTIYVSNNWNISNLNLTSDMFEDCTSLVGGNGTVYDSSKIGIAMAVIDTPSTPGYLTLKTA